MQYIKFQDVKLPYILYDVLCISVSIINIMDQSAYVCVFKVGSLEPGGK